MKNPLANRHGIGLIFALFHGSGALCPSCGYATRATSKNWAKCKKCGERVPRRSMDDVAQELARPEGRKGGE